MHSRAEHGESAQLRQQSLRFDVALNHMSHGLCMFDGKQQLFASLGYPDATFGMVKLTPDQQAMLVEGTPTAQPDDNAIKSPTTIRIEIATRCLERQIGCSRSNASVRNAAWASRSSGSALSAISPTWRLVLDPPALRRHRARAAPLQAHHRPDGRRSVESEHRDARHHSRALGRHRGRLPQLGGRDGKAVTSMLPRSSTRRRVCARSRTIRPISSSSTKLMPN